MPSFIFKTTECRVGVVGLANAGKTAFLTSLINHLREHDSDRFPFATGQATVRKFAELPSSALDPGWQPFPYAAFRDALAHDGRWPARTRDRSQFACTFQRTDWTFSDVLLKLYDLPGERVADAAMLARDFATWSDHLLDYFRNDTPYRTECGPFFDALHQPAATEADILTAYKLALIRLHRKYKPLISPSTFVLDAAGGGPRGSESDEAIAAARACGIDAANQFAPLSAECRTANPDLARSFAARYDRYKAEVAEPFLAALRNCHSLVILIDIPTLLAGGVGMYDDNRQIVADLLHALRPGENLAQRGLRHLSYLLLPKEWRPAWVNRVAFVSSKIDLVHSDDRDRLLFLLKRMVGKLADDHDGLTTAYFNCAAINSTKPLALATGARRLTGIPYRDTDGKKLPRGEMQSYSVPGVPDEWPVDWQPGQFHFPAVYPTVPVSKSNPPDQLNVNKVFDFVVV